MTTELQRDKNETLLLLHILYFLVGVGLFFFEDKAGMPKSVAFTISNEPISMQQIYLQVVYLFSVVFLLRWFLLDARQRDYKIPSILIALIIVSNTIGSIVYFVKTREKKDAGRIALKSARFLFGCIMAVTFGYLIISIVMGA